VDVKCFRSVNFDEDACCDRLDTKKMDSAGGSVVTGEYGGCGCPNPFLFDLEKYVSYPGYIVPAEKDVQFPEGTCPGVSSFCRSKTLNPDFNPQKCCGGKCPCPCGAADEKCPNLELFPAQCVCDKDVPLYRRGLLTGLRTATFINDTLLWEDCQDACEQDETCFYWTYSVDAKQCELKEGNNVVGVRFLADNKNFWGHVPKHAAPDLDPKNKSWWEAWHKALTPLDKFVRYGYLSAVEPKLTKSGNKWQDCEKSCTADDPPNCHWFVFDKTKMECKFYIKNGVYHEIDDNRSIVGPRLGNPTHTSEFSTTTPRPQTVDRTFARGPPA